MAPNQKHPLVRRWPTGSMREQRVQHLIAFFHE